MSVRVRFAPSPTGYLHIGGLRTALYNYLFARKNKGKLILRIEDTDRTRYVEGAIENLIKTLKWAGIQYDEGPDVGGEFGPYIQSERTELYRKHARILLESEQAYRCFCSSERLKKMREEKLKAGESTMYDKKCRFLSKEESDKLARQGQPFVIRLKVPEHKEVVVEDIIRGNVKFSTALIDDQVLLKSDGFPTYHLANVVDDHFMQITHVIRGEEWLVSTPKHILLYEAFKWEPPEFAHLPLLLNKDRSKLSKRQGDVACEDYIEKGYVKEALLNYIALLGWNPGEDREILSMDEMIELFSFQRVNPASAVFDKEKLLWMNHKYIATMDLTKKTGLIMEFLKKENLIKEDLMGERFEWLKEIVKVIGDRLKVIPDILPFIDFFFKEVKDYDEKGVKKFLLKDYSLNLLRDIKKIIEEEPLSPKILESQFRGLCEKYKLGLGKVMQPLRIALTGRTMSASLFEILPLLGRETALLRIQNLINYLENNRMVNE